MLPNHSPLVIAEQFGTLRACSRPHRFGLGRARGLISSFAGLAAQSHLGAEAFPAMPN